MDNLSKEQKIIILGLIISIIVGLSVNYFRGYDSNKQETTFVEQKETTQTESSPQLSILIHISGAVRREGVYRLNAGDRLLDAVKIAGGAQANADLSSLNLAEEVKDGQKIIVPFKQLVSSRISGDQDIGKSGSSSPKVSLNTADEKALDSLPGVGPSTAKAIVEYRQKNGPFTRLEQIMEIPRFGKNKYEKIKDKITL